MNTHRYKVVEVEAFRIPENEQTVAMPVWLLEAARKCDFSTGSVGDWVVKKPDGSFGIYTREAFEAEFEPVHGPRPTLHDHEREHGA